MPGAHMAIALWLTRGQEKTFPVAAARRSQHRRLDRDHRGARGAAGPRTRFIPRIPLSSAARSTSRTTSTKSVGPQVRLLGWHELRKDPELMGEVTETWFRADAEAPRLEGRCACASGPRSPSSATGSPPTRPPTRPGVMCSPGSTGWRPSSMPPGASTWWGTRFSVADLTAAALFYPVVIPPQGRQDPAGEPPAGFAAFRDSVSDRPGFRVEMVYENRELVAHRRRTASRPTTALAARRPARLELRTLALSRLEQRRASGLPALDLAASTAAGVGLTSPRMSRLNSGGRRAHQPSVPGSALEGGPRSRRLTVAAVDRLRALPADALLADVGGPRT